MTHVNPMPAYRDVLPHAETPVLGRFKSSTRRAIRHTIAFAVIGFFAFTPVSGALSATAHLTAASPWVAFADPLAPETGVPLIPAIFDSLTSLTDDGHLTSALAMSWQNDGHNVWTFKVRPNVVFNDGTQLDARAIAECLGILIGSQRDTYGSAAYTQDILAVRAIDAERVEITTKSQDARLDRKLANVRIFSAAAFNKMGRAAFAKSPVGTGPYKPVEWSPGGNGVLLEAVPTSWRAPAQIDRVRITVVGDATSRIQSLLSGKTDIAHAIDPDAIAAIEEAGFNVKILESPMVIALALRTSPGAAIPLKDRNVRIAMNMAINREAISQYLLKGTMKPATQFATPGVLGYDLAVQPYPYDLDRARKLLSEAGYGSGFRLVGMVSTGQIPGDQLVYQQVVQDLRSVGIEVQLNVLPINEFLRRRSATSWDGVDIYGTLLAHFRYGDISRSAELNSCIDPISTFCEPAMADLIERSNREMDPKIREQMLKTINAQFQDLAPVLQIVNFSSIIAYSKKFDSLPSTTGNIKFEEMRIIDKGK